MILYEYLIIFLSCGQVQTYKWHWVDGYRIIGFQISCRCQQGCIQSGRSWKSQIDHILINPNLQPVQPPGINRWLQIFDHFELWIFSPQRRLIEGALWSIRCRELRPWWHIAQLLHDAGGRRNHGGCISSIGRDNDGIRLPGHLLKFESLEGGLVAELITSSFTWSPQLCQEETCWRTSTYKIGVSISRGYLPSRDKENIFSGDDPHPFIINIITSPFFINCFLFTTYPKKCHHVPPTRSMVLPWTHPLLRHTQIGCLKTSCIVGNGRADHLDACFQHPGTFRSTPKVSLAKQPGRETKEQSLARKLSVF